MTINTTGIPLNVTKDPQCRHSERQGFVTYEAQYDAPTGRMQYRASCSNCGSVSPWVSADGLSATVADGREAARNALMKIEAEPLT